MGFKRDLNLGKTGEKIARKKIESLGFKTEDGDGKKIDFYVIFNKKYSCEVKYDIYSKKTGNLAIETFNTKTLKDSGINSTKCDLWIHVLSETEILFNTCKNLRKFISKTKPLREVTNAGDSNAHILLYQKDVILDGCLGVLNKDNLCKLNLI